MNAYWPTILDRAAALALHEPAFARETKARVFIAATPEASIILAMAAAIAGKAFVMGSQSSHDAPPNTIVLDDLSVATLDENYVINSEQLRALQTHLADSTRESVYFYTSGSSGQWKMIGKTWACLLAEATILCRMFGISAGDNVVSLVPPWHIYGFLYAFLAPYLSGAPVRYSLSMESMGIGSIIVTVPALWSRVLHGLDSNRSTVWRPRLLFSSGSALGDNRIAALGAKQREFGFDMKLIDVLGSTETGGIGWRELGSKSANEISADIPYEMFPGVGIAAGDDDTSLLMSPYATPPGVEVKLADQLQTIGDRHFKFLGRNDRIFKYSGKRYSLIEVENSLRALLPGRTLVCFFKVNSEAVKGGEVICFLEGEPVDWFDLRSQHAERFTVPFPSRVHAVTSLISTNHQMGKVTLAELERAVGEK